LLEVHSKLLQVYFK